MKLTKTRYFIRSITSQDRAFDYYVLEDGLVQVYFNDDVGWQTSIYSLDELTTDMEITGKRTEYSIEEFVLLCPYVLP